MQHKLLRKTDAAPHAMEFRGSFWDVILSGTAMVDSDVTYLMLSLISHVRMIFTSDAEFVTIDSHYTFLSNGCTVQFACLTVKAVVEIYTDTLIR